MVNRDYNSVLRVQACKTISNAKFVSRGLNESSSPELKLTNCVFSDASLRFIEYLDTLVSSCATPYYGSSHEELFEQLTQRRHGRG